MSLTMINLDTFERPDAPEPFAVQLGGREYVLRDTAAIDFREILAGYRAHAAGDMEPAIRGAVAPADREEFFANDLPSWKLDGLFNAYNKHFGIVPGEASGSPAS